MLRSPLRSHRSSSESSADGSPISTHRKSRLGMAGVANLFIRVRRLEKRAEGRQSQPPPPPAAKPGQIIVTSGEAKTHPCVARVVTPDQPGLPVEFSESYICAGGVNVVPLLVATRSSLQERVEALGADTLTDEQWECIITGPKPHPDGVYKVHIRYIASATNSPASNPGRPVALEHATGIPGLMTVLKRLEV